MTRLAMQSMIAFTHDRCNLVDNRLTILLDEGDMGTVAVKSYSTVLDVKHLVVLAGSRVRAGTSALGDSNYVPRLVVVDPSGKIVVDESGGIVSVEGIVERVKGMLPK